MTDPAGGEMFGFAQQGAGPDSEITFEASTYDAFNRLVAVRNDA